MSRKYLKMALGLAPIVAAVLLSDYTLHGFFVMMFGGMLIWIPYWLAWWLSDGFKGMSKWPCTGAPHTTGGVNPFTGKSCIVHHLPWGDNYTDGNS